MRKLLSIAILALLVSALVLPSIASAATYTYYTVSGSTLEEVQNDIDAKGPIDDEGNHRAGAADVSVSASGQMAPPKLTPITPEPWWMASISGTVGWTIVVTITLPTWGGYSQAGPNARAEWDRFIGALKAHEDQHEQIVQDAFRNLQPPAMSNFTGVGIGPSQQAAIDNANKDLQNKIDQEIARVQAALQAASDQYDDETNHGEDQGAVLDTSITDETPQEGIDGLKGDVEGSHASEGLKKSLKSILDNALKSLEKGNNTAAKNQLNSFINHVNAQAGKKNGPTKEETQGLASEAQQIRDSIK